MREIVISSVMAHDPSQPRRATPGIFIGAIWIEGIPVHVAARIDARRGGVIFARLREKPPGCTQEEKERIRDS